MSKMSELHLDLCELVTKYGSIQLIPDAELVMVASEYGLDYEWLAEQLVTMQEAES